MKFKSLEGVDPTIIEEKEIEEGEKLELPLLEKEQAELSVLEEEQKVEEECGAEAQKLKTNLEELNVDLEELNADIDAMGGPEKFIEYYRDTDVERAKIDAEIENLAGIRDTGILATMATTLFTLFLAFGLSEDLNPLNTIKNIDSPKDLILAGLALLPMIFSAIQTMSAVSIARKMEKEVAINDLRRKIADSRVGQAKT